MSQYQVSKLLFHINRDEAVKARFLVDRASVLDGYRLTDEEQRAVMEPDIGLLYVIGVNGQILMHFAALCGIEWADYIQRMRDGVKLYGAVRAGVYAMTTRMDEKVAGV